MLTRGKLMELTRDGHIQLDVKRRLLVFLLKVGSHLRDVLLFANVSP
jgi:hypothetical protein